MNGVRFVDLLTAQAEAIGSRRNAAHTRLKIQIAACHLLQESGYEKLNISAICKKVNLTRPGFYLHYSNKVDVILALLRALVEAEAQLSPTLTDCKDLAQAIEKICDWYLRFHIGSGALFSTLTEVRRSVPEVYELWNNRSSDLLDAMIYQLQRFQQFHDIDKEWAAFSIEATARAMNVTADRMNSFPGPITSRYADDIDRLVRMFTRMMYQSMMAEPLTTQRSKIIATPDKVNG